MSSSASTVADPYRWLENDVRNDAEVAAWVAAQNKVTDAYLDTLPGRAAFAARMSELYDYERFGVPQRRAAAISTRATTACRTSRCSTSATAWTGRGPGADRSQ